LEDRVEHSTFIEKIEGKIVHNRCWGLGQREVRRRGAGYLILRANMYKEYTTQDTPHIMRD